MKEWPFRCSDYFMDEIRRSKFETIKIWRISSNLTRRCNSSLVRPKAMLGLVWPYKIRRKYRNTYTGSSAFWQITQRLPGNWRGGLKRFSGAFRAGAPSPLPCLLLAHPFFLVPTTSKRLLRRLFKAWNPHHTPLSTINNFELLLGMRRNSHQTLQGPVVRRPLTWRGLKFTSGFLFFWSKAFSRIIFSTLFRASNYQIVDKKN